VLYLLRRLQSRSRVAPVLTLARSAAHPGRLLKNLGGGERAALGRARFVQACAHVARLEEVCSALERGGLTFKRHASTAEDVNTIGEGKCHVHVLFDEQDPHPLVDRESSDGREELFE
jgi:hypothetical protein